MKKRLQLKELKIQQNKYDDFLKEIEMKLKTKLSKESFDNLKNITVLKPNKRDGDIFKMFLNEENDLILNQKKIVENCYNELSKIAG